MNCKTNPGEFVDSIKDGIKDLRGAAGGGVGLAGLLGKELNAPIDGQVHDPSLKDYAQAAQITDLAALAKYHQALNAGKTADAS